MDFVPPLPKSRIWKSKADFFRPFRSAAADEAASITPLIYDPALPRTVDACEPNLKDLNCALEALVEIFPDVQTEVFREMLVSVSEESRLQVVMEHLLRKKAKWVKGRWKTPQQQIEARRPSIKSRPTQGVDANSQGTLREDDRFRSESYKKAVKQVFYEEFKNLSRSTIKGVLAEQNYSYTLARPILQGLASRSWRFSLTNFWPRKATGADGLPFIIWQDSEGPQFLPALRLTGNSELDRELYELFVAPILREKRRKRLRTDYATASELNQSQAEEANALFDCECCYSSVPFEDIATCEECHILCLDCIRRTANEALYGQGWARAADLHRCTVRCFASADCQGSIPPHLVRRALLQGSDNEDAWRDLQTRMTTETLLHSGLPLQRCPFCNYAEVDEPPPPHLKNPLAIWSHISSRSAPAIQILFLSLPTALTVFTIPLLIAFFAAYALTLLLPFLSAPLRASISRIQTQRSNPKFACLDPCCSTITCKTCSAPWTDPHTCFSTELTTLRTAIESATTAAIKRVCPKCHLSFVKASGCNKLVCNCGYTMCYICRQEITSKEGYAHFCQHFRPSGGRCGECERCDLYGDEDEEVVVRRAAEGAERQWREREMLGKGSGGGQKGRDEGTRRAMIETIVGSKKRVWWEEVLDAVVDAVMA